MPGHHDRALAERRKAQAVELAAQGYGYDEITREVEEHPVMGCPS